MKIAYVTMAFPAKSETFACNDVRTLTSLVEQVDVYCLKRKAADADELATQRGVRNVFVSHNSLLQSVSGLCLMLRSPMRALWIVSIVLRKLISTPGQLSKSLLLLPRSFAVFHELSKKHFDVVHLFWGHYPSLVGLLVGEYLKDVQLTMFLGAYDLTMKYPLSSLAAQHAKTVFTHARSNEQALTDRGIDQKKICVIYRGIDLERFEEADDERDAYKIISSGRLIESKGFQYVIEAFAELRQKDEKYRLAIYGEGPFRGRLQELVERRQLGRQVNFVGHVQQSNLIEALKRAGFYLFLSTKDSERLPNCVKEALAAGCFVVSSKTPGIDELVLPESSGVLVDVGDTKGIVETIRAQTENYDKLGPRRQKSIEHIAEHFDAKRSMRVYVEQWNRSRSGILSTKAD